VAGIGCDEVVGAGGVGTFEEDVVGGSGGGGNAAGREKRNTPTGSGQAPVTEGPQR